MRRGLASLIAGLLVIVSFSGLAFADNLKVNDLSWPNCGAKLPSLTSAGIVGINDGLDFSSNPCLASESLLFHNSYALYLSTGYPGKSYALKFKDYPKDCQKTNNLCLAYNYGYNDVLYSVKYADAQNSHSFVWWLDVESVNSWTNAKQNRQALLGMISALKKETLMPTIGFYSYPGQWLSITKSWKNYYPAWVASASDSQNTAAAYCTDSFNGGPVWFSQYTKVLDYNYSCLPKVINNFKIH